MTASLQVGVRDCLAGRTGSWSTFSDSDREALLIDAIRHGMAPWLYRQLRSLHFASAAPVLLDKLHEIYLHNCLRNLAVWQQLRELLRAFGSAGIPVILLKGAHLAEIVYRDPALRPLADLDLLVRRDDLARAEELLRNLGYSIIAGYEYEVDYSKHHHLQPYCKSGAIPVEIHHTIEAPGAKLTIVDDLWSRAQNAVIAGVEARVLCPEDLLLHLCLHAAYNHRFQVPLLQLCDIAVSIQHFERQIDWQQLAKTSNEYGSSRFVYCTLSLIQEALGAKIPPGVFQILSHEDGDRDVLPAILGFLLSAPDELAGMRRRLGESKGLPEKARVLARSLFPTLRELRRTYRLPATSKSACLYYLVRPVDLLLHYGPLLLGLAFRSKRFRPAAEREAQRRLIHRWVNDCAQGRR